MSESIFPSATLRGGWLVSGAISRAEFAYDPDNYLNLSILRPRGSLMDTVAFIVPGVERNQFCGSLRVTTPALRFLSASASAGRGATPIFREAAPGRAPVWMQRAGLEWLYRIASNPNAARMKKLAALPRFALLTLTKK